jgi:hypothetical protein
MSAGCSLDDAFPDAVPRLPGQKKKRSTKGPALAFLKGVDSDPDRPFVGNVPEEEKPFAKAEGLRNAEGLRSAEGFKNQDDPTVDIIGKGPVKDSYNHAVSSYFGKSETDENLSNFSPAVEDKTGYILNPVFPAKLSDSLSLSLSPSHSSLDTSANTNDTWKPMTSGRSGIQTAYFGPSDTAHSSSRERSGEIDKLSGDVDETMVLLRRQIDTLFARLESMEHRRSEFSHSELGLFILTGLFIMFGLDTVRRFR